MGNLVLRSIVVGMLRTNCYFLVNRNTKEMIIVDPGDHSERITQAVRAMEGKPVAILLTHGHFDHMLAADELKNQYQVNIYAAQEEEEVLMNSSKNCAEEAGKGNYLVKADIWVKPKEVLQLAGFSIEVIATPGHTKGSVCYYIEEEQVLMSGDTIFLESYGRTDLATGSTAAIVRSIQSVLETLPDGVTIYPGHGEPTTIAHEKEYNPFYMEKES